MELGRLTNPEAYKQALAGLLRRGGEVTDFIATAPEKAGQAILEGHEKNKALQAQAFANPNRPFQVTNQQAMGELGDRMLAGPLSVAPVGMIAYHGTPHTILDKFDISKVGTGEGAQAYGHGMYFAEAPDVAKSYATDRSYVGKFMAGKPDKTPWEANRIAQDTLNVHGDNAVAQLEKTLKNNSFSKNPQQIEANKQVQNAIDLLKTNQFTSKGNLYKVDIPDEYIPKMLDYDKPLKEQANIVEMLKTSKNKDIQKMIANLDNFANSNNPPTGQNLLKTLGYAPDTPKKASKLLDSLGIKGVRYLDQASRGAKTGTSNYVVFDPTDVKILERNNQPISRKELLQQQIDKIE